MKKKKQKKQIINYLKFVVAGILLVIIVALVSGCGSQVQDDGSSSGKRVLSKSEIQELTDLVVVDAEEISRRFDEGEEVEGISTIDSDVNSHCTYVMGYRSDGEDDEDFESILAQVSPDRKVLQTFSEDEIKLHPGKKEWVELMGVTDQEIICSADLYDEGEDADTWYRGDAVIWYRIPLSYENGQEKVLCDRKEIIYHSEDLYNKLYCGKGRYLLCENSEDLFVLNQESGEKWKIDFGILGDYGYCESADPWIDSEGDLHVVLAKYQDGVPDALDIYQTKTQSVQKITDGITSESRITTGDGKVFFTGLADKKMSNDYNLYIYDMETGQKKVLAWESKIRDMLPGKPSDNADIIRELVYAQGTLYLEIRYGKESYVLSCTPEDGTLTLLEGISELVKHTEYQLPESIKDGNSKYCSVNDHNIFEVAEDGVVERTLDGAYVRTIHLSNSDSWPYGLVYVNNQEMIYRYMPNACAAPVFCSIPLTQMDGNDYPEVSRKTVITKGTENDAAGEIMGLYADERYLVYYSSIRRFGVYDRKAKAFVDLENLPGPGQGFSCAGDICFYKCLCGDNLFLNSAYKSDKGLGYQLSLYHLGDQKVNRIDPSCFTTGDARWCEDGTRIIYERLSSKKGEEVEYCSYDISTGNKELLFTETDLQKLVKMKEMGDVEMISAAGKLYLAISSYGEFGRVDKYEVCSYDLAGEGGLQYEPQISAFMGEQQGMYQDQFYMIEGKLFLTAHQEDKDGKTIKDGDKYYYYDLETGRGAEFGKGDPEWLYLSFC